MDRFILSTPEAFTNSKRVSIILITPAWVK
jgi:hypothetical protein